MYNKNKITVVVPAYNEERLISPTLKSIPKYVDHIIAIDDNSTDSTPDILAKAILKDNRILVLTNKKNRGVGFSIKRGYQKALDLQSDITVVVAGDGQMDTKYMPSLIDPIIEGNAAYTKGDRLSSSERKKMPTFRRFGNSILTLFTKISTGYWHVIDPQNGYTAINKIALKNLLKEKITEGYGNPNDFLIGLNIHNFKVSDVEIPPLYGSEKSGIKIPLFIFKTMWILISGFFRRINKKYGGLNFHPILLFFYLGFFFTIFCTILIHRMTYLWYLDRDIPDLTALGVGITFLGSCQFILFALWMDSELSK